jgi:hypothetical protein
MLNAPAIATPVQVLVSGGMLSVLLAALIAIWVLLLRPRHPWVTQIAGAVASTALVSVGILSLAAAIMLQTVQDFGAQAPGPGAAGRRA